MKKNKPKKSKKPKVLKSHIVSCYDCDDTLVRWIWDQNEKEELRHKLVKFHIKNIVYHTSHVWLLPNEEVITNLKLNKTTGSSIIVWSAGGYSWAEEVVKVLKLEEYVDIIMSKPSMYVDDLPCAEWMGKWLVVKDDGTIIPKPTKA